MESAVLFQVQDLMAYITRMVENQMVKEMEHDRQAN